MVAVALMPPLVVFGMLLADGFFSQAVGALLLLSANVVCINLAGVATFLAQGVRPRTWWEEQRAQHATRLAIGIWFVLLLALGAILYVTASPAIAQRRSSLAPAIVEPTLRIAAFVRTADSVRAADVPRGDAPCVTNALRWPPLCRAAVCRRHARLPPRAIGLIPHLQQPVHS